MIGFKHKTAPENTYKEKGNASETQNKKFIFALQQLIDKLESESTITTKKTSLNRTLQQA